MDCSPQGSSVHGISQARILEWAAISSSKGSFWIRDQTLVSWVGRWIFFFTTELPGKTLYYIYFFLNWMFLLNLFSLSPFSSPPLPSKLSFSSCVLYCTAQAGDFRSILSAPPSLSTASSNCSPSYVHSFSENIFKLPLFQSMTFRTSLLNHCNSHHWSLASVLSTVSERYSWSRVSNIYCGPP